MVACKKCKTRPVVAAKRLEFQRVVTGEDRRGNLIFEEFDKDASLLEPRRLIADDPNWEPYGGVTWHRRYGGNRQTPQPQKIKSCTRCRVFRGVVGAR